MPRWRNEDVEPGAKAGGRIDPSAAAFEQHSALPATLSNPFGPSPGTPQGPLPGGGIGGGGGGLPFDFGGNYDPSVWEGLFQGNGMGITSPVSAVATTAGKFAMDPLSLALGLASVGQGVFGAIMGNSQANKQNALSKEQLALQAAIAQLTGSQSAGLQPAMERQKAALLYAMLQGARPPQVNIPSEFKPYAGNVRAPFQIPEGGFPQELIQFLSPESLRAQEENYQARLNNLPSGQSNPLPLPRVGYPTTPRPEGTAIPRPTPNPRRR